MLGRSCVICNAGTCTANSVMSSDAVAALGCDSEITPAADAFLGRCAEAVASCTDFADILDAFARKLWYDTFLYRSISAPGEALKKPLTQRMQLEELLSLATQARHVQRMSRRPSWRGGRLITAIG